MSRYMIGDRIRMVRNATGLGRTRFARKIGVNDGSLRYTENTANSCDSALLEAICEHYPEFTLWLLTEKTLSKAGQIRPGDTLAYDYSGLYGHEEE